MAGTAGINNALVVGFTQTIAGAANNDYTLTRSGGIANCWIITRAASPGGTFQLSRVPIGNAAAPITDAMNAATDLAVTYNGTIDDTTYRCVAGDALRFQTVGGATLVDAIVLFVPVPVANNVPVV